MTTSGKNESCNGVISPRLSEKNLLKKSQRFLQNPTRKTLKFNLKSLYLCFLVHISLSLTFECALSTCGEQGRRSRGRKSDVARNARRAQLGDPLTLNLVNKCIFCAYSDWGNVCQINGESWMRYKQFRNKWTAVMGSGKAQITLSDRRDTDVCLRT